MTEKNKVRKFEKGLSVAERASIVYSEMSGNEKRTNRGKFFRIVSLGGNIGDALNAYLDNSEKTCIEVHAALGIKW